MDAVNAVDELTQFEVVCTVEKIAEHYLIPVLEQLLDIFPFVIKGFHSDNGSEYINKQVAKLLEKLLIEFTKSRARQTNENALAESKNASIVRKYLGYSHMPQKWAPLINEFNQTGLQTIVSCEDIVITRCSAVFKQGAATAILSANQKSGFDDA
ncbi:MAG: hypothetical protein PHD43_21525 [Methylococcales bacterium]|nr:hypothetical protein [Methylococcales bacterium]